MGAVLVTRLLASVRWAKVSASRLLADCGRSDLPPSELKGKDGRGGC
jgi:hypothetical protein